MYIYIYIYKIDICGNIWKTCGHMVGLVGEHGDFTWLTLRFPYSKTTIPSSPRLHRRVTIPLGIWGRVNFPQLSSPTIWAQEDISALFVELLCVDHEPMHVSRRRHFPIRDE